MFKSSIFIVQKAAAPKNGVEFRQGSNGTITSGLATSYDVWRRRAMSQAYSTAAWWVYSLAILCDAWWRHQTNWELRNFEVGDFRPIREDRVYHSWSPTSTNQRPLNCLRQIHTHTDRESTYSQALLYEQRLQNVWKNVTENQLRN